MSGHRSLKSKNSIDISRGIIQDAIEDPEFLEQILGANGGSLGKLSFRDDQKNLGGFRKNKKKQKDYMNIEELDDNETFEQTASWKNPNNMT